MNNILTLVLCLSLCVQCGRKLPEGVSFCPNCGAPVTLQEIEKFIKQLTYGTSEWMRKDAARALGKIGDARAVEPLIKALKEDEVLVSAEAARALGKIGGARAVEALMKALKEDSRVHSPSEESQLLGVEDVRMREEATRALGKIGELAVEPLIEAIHMDPLIGLKNGRSAYLYAIEALGATGDPRAVEPLISELARGRGRLTAVEALGEIGDPRAVKPLIEALKDVSEFVQKAAVLALSKIGGEEAEKALKIFKTAVKTVSLLEKNRDVEGLIKALKDEDLVVRRGAASALGKIRDARAVEPLIQALKDKDSSVRWGAAVALGRIGDARATEPLNQALKDENSVVRSFAKEALRKIRS
jgi:HEAT repeat protein